MEFSFTWHLPVYTHARTHTLNLQNWIWITQTDREEWHKFSFTVTCMTDFEGLLFQSL